MPIVRLNMRDRKAVAAGLLCEAGILPKLGVELGFGRRQLAVGERDAIEHATMLLETERRIVQHGWTEGDRAERVATVPVLALPVALHEEAAVSRDEQGAG